MYVFSFGGENLNNEPCTPVNRSFKMVKFCFKCFYEGMEGRDPSLSSLHDSSILPHNLIPLI